MNVKSAAHECFITTIQSVWSTMILAPVEVSVQCISGLALTAQEQPFQSLVGEMIKVIRRVRSRTLNVMSVTKCLERLDFSAFTEIGTMQENRSSDE